MEKQDIINSILGDLPSETAIQVELPSECRAYNLGDSPEPIVIRPMTFEDEKFLATTVKASGGAAVDLLLDRCVEGVKVQDLLAMDKLYLLLKLREISYGDDYKTTIICRKCRTENPITVLLSELPVNPVPDDFTDPVEVLLPTINKKAKVRLPRVRDEKILVDPEVFMAQLWRFVAEIDGHTDKAILAGVVEKLPLKDMKTIINAMKMDYGVETKVNFKCKSCGGAEVVDLPIDENFFNVS